MKSELYEKFANDDITVSMVREAAKLFSENYGMWSKIVVKIGKAGPSSPSHRKSAFANSNLRLHVKFIPERLQAFLLPEGADCALARVTVDGKLAGHALACYWRTGGADMMVEWVTQLVVHNKYREQGLATGLLNMLRRDDVRAWGILSSQPAAYVAMAEAFPRSIDRADLNYLHCWARDSIRSSPIQYVREAHSCGSLFGASNSHDSISAADTEFDVDHTEPTMALHRVQAQNRWSLGGMEDGHEYLLVVKAKVHLPKSRA